MIVLFTTPDWASSMPQKNASSGVENLGNDAEGRHIYRFHRNDGFEVIAAWTSRGGTEALFPQTIIADPASLDALGRPVKAVEGTSLRLNGNLQYFFPKELLPKLGLSAPLGRVVIERFKRIGWIP